MSVNLTISLELILGLLAALIAFMQLHKINEQLKSGFFSDYTKRYQEIILNFPENVNDKDFEINSLSVADRDRFMRYVRVYFDLCSEEYFLHKKKYVDNEVWEEWKSGIQFAFTKPAFIQAWEIVKFDTKYYSDFNRFLDEIREKKTN